MAEVTLRLRVDPQTRRKTVVVEYSSDADALPMEHEEDHRAIVDRLIEAGAITEADRDNVVIERSAEQAPVSSASEPGALSSEQALDESQ
ncbi:MAG TPA: hypothetical protein ENK18_12935 [Deltaproteobacteria bacterium]|nr:hypothetical protein [Deltaproteobacteria bacterium]